MSTETLEERQVGQEDAKKRLAWLADQLEAGFGELHCLKRKGLDLALRYGPFLLEWKELVGHGGWQKDVREKVKGADLRTCNRWKRIAEHRTDVDDALTRWPDVRWGLVRMLDYLSGKFDPDNPIDDEDDGGDDAGPAEADATGNESGETDGLGSAGTGGGQETIGEETTPPTLQFPTVAQTRPGVNGTARPPANGRARKKPPQPPVPAAGAEVMEYEVEVVQAFKVVVPKNVSEEGVKKAFEDGEVRLQASVQGKPWTFSDEEMRGRLNHVRPWD